MRIGCSVHLFYARSDWIGYKAQVIDDLYTKTYIALC